jgi:nucleoside-diphosphate-sugar epimerase
MTSYFITGGAGFLGINLVRYLMQRGHQVTVYDIAPFDYPESSMIRNIRGDIRDRDYLIACMQGSHVVIHAAAALPLYTPEDIRSTDIDGTENVCEAALKNGARRLIHISSTAVYGIPDHHPLHEDDALNGVGEYGNAKIAAEDICVAYRRKGMIIPIIRPKSFIGPERLGVFALFYDWAADGRGFPVIGDGNNRYQLLDVEDLCEAIYLSATLDPKRVNDTFNIGAKDFLTLKEDYQAVLDAAGFGKKIRGFPAWPMIWTLRILERLRLSPLYKWVYETASTDSFVSIEKSKHVLGFDPKYSNKEALVRNFRWYLEHRHEFGDKSGVSHRVPWKQGVLSLAKYCF